MEPNGIVLQNESVRAVILLQGAELTELSQKNGGNVLWKKNDIHWNRVAPNLFPIVGRLINDTYLHNGKEYSMSQHGFARDKEFSLLEHTNERAIFSLRSDSSTSEKYPFDFEFRVTYNLLSNGIEVTYTTLNTGMETMFYSVGGHPAFSIEGRMEDHYLCLPEASTIDRHLLKGSHFSAETAPVHFDPKLPLSYSFFEQDAMVFIGVPFKSITLGHLKNGPILTMQSDNWEAIGIWTKKDAPFICIEPWWGWADQLSEKNGSDIDFKGENRELKNKAGIRRLKGSDNESMSYRILFE